MKKRYILAALVLSFFCTPLLAVNVSVSKAEQAARMFFKLNPQTRSADVSLTLVYEGGSNPLTRGSVSASSPYYVFNNASGGFAIIAGDDKVEPVLGFSYTDRFDPDNISDALQYWLDGYRYDVEQARKSNAEASSEVKGRWEQLLHPTKATQEVYIVRELSTPLWGQGEPFNNNCPLVGGTRCLTGCTATAPAILMAYYARNTTDFNCWPDAGYGSTPAYTTSSGLSVPSEALHTYDWSNMLYSYNSDANPAQNQAVAYLCSDLAKLLKSEFGTGGTAALPEKIGAIMVQNMKYSSSYSFLLKSAYTNKEWIELLKSNISRGLPVLYSAFTVSGVGHTFILDGYASNDFIKFNWGWNGQNNGYYYISASQYNQRERAYFDLMPDKAWTAGSTYYSLSYYVDEDSGHYGISAGVPYIKQGVTTDVKVELVNRGSGTYSGQVKLARLSKSGKLADLSGCIGLELPANNYCAFNFTNVSIDSVSDGDAIVLAYKTSADSWMHMPGNGIELVYKLKDKVSMEYDGSNIKLKGLIGMTCNFNGSNYKFTAPVLTIPSPSPGSYNMKIGNGNEEVTVKLKF